MIPYVIDATTPITALEINYPQYCPICRHETINETDVLIKCPNEECNAKIIGQIIHFCSKDCMDIRTIGERVAEDLVNEGIVEDISELYCLKNDYTPEKGDPFLNYADNLEKLGAKILKVEPENNSRNVVF